MKQTKRSRKSKTTPLLAVLLALTAFLLVEFDLLPDTRPVQGNYYEIDADLSVHFIDVGQGESIFIQAPEKTILIDAGENGKGVIVVDYLKSLGVSHLDYVVATHPHSDHIGGMTDVLATFSSGTILMPDLPEDLIPTTRTYLDLLTLIDRQGGTITASNPLDTYDLGNGATLQILGPVVPHKDLNNMSIICRVDYGSTSFLFTGDAEKDSEWDLVESGYNLRADVLSVAHHGSRTSSQKVFVEAVRPIAAAISVGDKNSYNHPHPETVETLSNYCEIYRTDLLGTIVFASDGSTITMESQRGVPVLIKE